MNSKQKKIKKAIDNTPDEKKISFNSIEDANNFIVQSFHVNGLHKNVAHVNGEFVKPSEIAQQIRAAKITNGGVAEEYITNIFNIQTSLVTESLVAKACVEFLVRSFNRPFEFEGTAFEIDKAKKKFEDLCFDKVFKMQLLTECAVHGGISPQVSFAPSDEMMKGVQGYYPKSIFHDRFVNFRLANVMAGEAHRPSQPQAVKRGVDWTKYYRRRKNTQKVTLPILGASINSYGSKYHESKKGCKLRTNIKATLIKDGFINEDSVGFTGVFYGMEPHAIIDYYPLPYYYSLEGIDAMRSTAKMQMIKQGYIDRGMHLSYIVVINRTKKTGVDKKGRSKEEKQLNKERAMLEKNIGTQGAGKLLVIVNEDFGGEKSRPPIELIPIPAIQSHDFFKYMDNDNFTRGLMAFGIPNRNFVGMETNESGGFANQASKMYTQFTLLAGGIGQSITMPIIDFANFLLCNSDIDARVVKMEDPILMQQLKGYSEKNNTTNNKENNNSNVQ